MKKSELMPILFEKDLWKCTKVTAMKSKAGNDMHVFQFQSTHVPEIKVCHFQVDTHLGRWLKQMDIEEPFQAEGEDFRVREWSTSKGVYFIGRVEPVDVEISVEPETLLDLPF